MLSLFTILIACSTKVASPPSDSSGPPSDSSGSPEEIASCQRACDQQQFFECYDAVEHGWCFDRCEVVDSSAITRFTACVGNNTCDSECDIHLEEDSATVVPTVVPTSQCSTLCTDFVADQCVPDLAAADCAFLCEQAESLVVGCLEGRVGCELSQTCQGLIDDGGGPDTPVDICEDECNSLGVFDCITPTDVVTCTNLCTSSPTGTVEQFNTCTLADPICSDDSCYRILNPAGASADVSGCRDECDDMAFFNCLDPGQQNQCRSDCAQASASAVDDFIACNTGICDDDTCWLLMQSTL